MTYRWIRNVDGRLLRERAASSNLKQFRGWRLLYDSTVRQWDRLHADVFGAPPDVAERDDAEDGEFNEEDNRRFREQASPVISEAQWSTLAGMPDCMIIDIPPPTVSPAQVPQVPLPAPAVDAPMANEVEQPRMRIASISTLVFDRLGFRFDRSVAAPVCSMKIHGDMFLLGLTLHMLGGERYRDAQSDTTSRALLHMATKDDHRLGWFLEVMAKQGSVLVNEQPRNAKWQRDNGDQLCFTHLLQR
jgi:hypothetical protein